MTDLNKLAISAMQTNKRVSLNYHGEDRIVEIHALGLSKKGKPCVRVFQVLGGAVFGATSGWKMLSLAEIEDAKILDIDSDAPRPGYNPGDRGMSTILKEISDVPVPKQAEP